MKIKFFSRILISLLLLFFTLTAYANLNKPNNTNSTRPNVLLISIDGLKPNYILQPDKYNLKIPNIQKLLANSAYAPSGMKGVTPTITFASHTAMLTGTNPGTNGIVNNQMSIGPQTEYNFFVSDKVENLWSEATKAGYLTVNIGLPVSIGSIIDYDIPTFWKSNSATDLKYVNQLCTPKGLVNKLSNKIGPYTYKLKSDNYLAADIWKFKAAEYLLIHEIKNSLQKTNAPVFMTMYFMDLDNEQHNNGLYNTRTKHSLETIDKMIGSLIKTFKSITGKNTIINLVSDHGFVNVSKDIHINTALKDAGYISVNKNEQIKDWNAYASYAGGMCAILLKNTEDQKLQNNVYNFLLNFSKNSENGIKKLYTKKDLEEAKAFPKASFALSAKHGYKFSSSLSNQVITKSNSKGAHGHAPNDPELYATYLISGPDIAKGKKLTDIKLIDVAPTLAQLMGIKLTTGEGKVINLKNDTPAIHR